MLRRSCLSAFPLRQLQNFFSIIRKPFLAAKEDPAEVIDELVHLAEIARKDGLLALEAIAREIRNPFIALGVQLAVDGTRPETLSEIMQNEVEALAGRHRQAKKVVELVGRCGPAFGMIATLLGLILMLGSLSKPDTVGPSMAIALIGTLYGAPVGQFDLHSVGREARLHEPRRGARAANCHSRHLGHPGGRQSPHRAAKA